MSNCYGPGDSVMTQIITVPTLKKKKFTVRWRRKKTYNLLLMTVPGALREAGRWEQSWKILYRLLGNEVNSLGPEHGFPPLTRNHTSTTQMLLAHVHGGQALSQCSIGHVFRMWLVSMPISWMHCKERYKHWVFKTDLSRAWLYTWAAAIVRMSSSELLTLEVRI